VQWTHIDTIDIPQSRAAGTSFLLYWTVVSAKGVCFHLKHFISHRHLVTLIQNKPVISCSCGVSTNINCKLNCNKFKDQYAARLWFHRHTGQHWCKYEEHQPHNFVLRAQSYLFADHHYGSGVRWRSGHWSRFAHQLGRLCCQSGHRQADLVTHLGVIRKTNCHVSSIGS